MAGEEQPLTEYEKERLARIRENEARLQALGIRRLSASPLFNQPSPAAAAAAKRKKKKPCDDVDEEYLPSESDEGGGDEEDEEEASSSASDQEDEEGSKASSRSRQKEKAKKKVNLGSSSKTTFREVADFVDDDAALQQAIALSLAEPSKSFVLSTVAETSSTGAKGRKGTPGKDNNTTPIKDSATVAETSCTGAKGRKTTPCKDNNTTPFKDSAKTRKTKKQVRSRIQLSEDDVVTIFFSFDEAGKGYITPWDLEKMANVNDFIWTDFEISKMIQCFDCDKDGKINLEEFRAIVSRCNMLQEPGE